MASSPDSARSRLRCLPRSQAVRSGVVTRRPCTSMTSFGRRLRSPESVRPLRSRPMPAGRKTETGRSSTCSLGASTISAPWSQPACRSQMTQSSGTTSRSARARSSTESPSCETTYTPLTGRRSRPSRQSSVRRFGLTPSANACEEVNGASRGSGNVSSRNGRVSPDGDGHLIKLGREPETGMQPAARLWMTDEEATTGRVSDGRERADWERFRGERRAESVRAGRRSRSRNQMVSASPVTPAAGMSWTVGAGARARATAPALPSPLTRNHTGGCG